MKQKECSQKFYLLSESLPQLGENDSAEKKLKTISAEILEIKKIGLGVK